MKLKLKLLPNCAKFDYSNNH